MATNRLRAFRESQLLTKAELARKAGISTLTIDRIEAGYPCRIDTKRKIILALGLKISDKHKIFQDDGVAVEREVVVARATPGARRRNGTR
jgi:DNA-binding XRE family transcriptional regulator